MEKRNCFGGEKTEGVEGAVPEGFPPEVQREAEERLAKVLRKMTYNDGHRGGMRWGGEDAGS